MLHYCVVGLRQGVLPAIDSGGISPPTYSCKLHRTTQRSSKIFQQEAPVRSGARFLRSSALRQAATGVEVAVVAALSSPPESIPPYASAAMAASRIFFFSMRNANASRLLASTAAARLISASTNSSCRVVTCEEHSHRYTHAGTLRLWTDLF